MAAGTSTRESADERLAATIAGCTAAHRRLFETLRDLDDNACRQPSRLPGWSVGHVLTHLARNADSHVRMLEGASRGETLEQYAGGYEQRRGDIESGAHRPAALLVDDVTSSTARLEETWSASPPEAWAGHGLARGRRWDCRDLPFHRWREVELHHVDLGLGHAPADWPVAYVAEELPLALAGLPGRLDDDSRARLLAWLVGREGSLGDLPLGEWEPVR